ncbi:MAG: McrC family protein [Pseudomonadota bacterium]
MRAAGLKGGLFTHANRHTLKARQYVGVVQLGADAIEIIPKIDGLDERGTRLNLFRMLARTRRLQVHEADLARLAEQDLNILEIFIRLFCDKLFAEVHRGLVSQYERHQDNLPALRGKLRVDMQVTLNAFQPERFQCEFDEFTVDTPLNRILKAAVRRLRRISHHADNTRRLAELDFALEGVRDVPAQTLEWHRLHFDRANRRYESLATMARMILDNRSQDVTSGGVEGFGLIFDMNELLEEYLGEMARAAFLPHGWSVSLQGPRQYLLENADTGEPAFQTKPDIVIQRPDGPTWIIDTKWKRLDIAERNGNIGQGDVYQMLAYAQRYQASDIVLLYPHAESLTFEPGRCWSYRTKHLANDTRIHIATIDLTDLNRVDNIIGQLHKLIQ